MSIFVELKNTEKYEFCTLDKTTGQMEFYSRKKTPGFTGIYFKDNNTFFALYPTENGPKVFYKSKEYEINENLTISLVKEGKRRRFCISDYGIDINYEESDYIDWDAWSEEIDVDLFFMLEQSYNDQSFYNKFTLK